MAEDHERNMLLALEEAKKAGEAGNRAVGSVIVRDGKVAGPILITRSKHDRAVGWLYPAAAAPVRDVDFAPGEPPKYGAIGAFGARGLDAMDRRFLGYLAEHCGGGPVGVETLAAALAEQRDVLEDVIEPYLIQQGYLQRTQRGRMLTLQGWRYLGLEAPSTAAEQPELIEAEDDVPEAGNA